MMGTLLALGLLAYLLWQQGWEEILAAFRQIPTWRLAACALLMVVSRLAVAARWHVLLAAADPQIQFAESLRITFAGLFATNFLPTTVGGDVVRLAGAIQRGMDTALSAASLIADRLVGMAGMAMVVPFGLSQFLAARQLALLAHPPILSGSLTLPLSRFWRSAWEKALSLVREMLSALSFWLKQPRALFLSLAFTWIHMLCIFAILQNLLAGMGDTLPFWLIGGLYSIVYFVTLLPISINSYGLQEVSITLVFTQAGGATLAAALAAALVYRTLMMLASLPGALFIPSMMTSRGEPPES